MKPKYEPLNAPESNQDLADQLRWLSLHMADISTSMLLDKNEAIISHGYELTGAAELCREWAENIEKETS